MDVDQIRVLKDKRFGWLRADGTLLGCAQFEHFKVLESEPDLSLAYRTYSEILDSNAWMMAEDIDALGPDDHPGMHRFDGMDDDAKRDMAIACYEAGWVRLGLRPNGIAMRNPRGMADWLLDRSNWSLEAEGFHKALSLHRRALKELSEIVEARLDLREVMVAKVRRGGKRSTRFDLLLMTPEIHMRLADNGELF